jgi:hypothetical protein
MIYNYIVSSHGEQVCYNINQHQVINLPSNVVVIMNCTNSSVLSEPIIDSHFWQMTFNNIFAHLKNISVDQIDNTLNAYFKLLNERLNETRLAPTKNTYCFYLHECPNIQFTVERRNFKSGFYTLPVNTIIDHDEFKLNEYDFVTYRNNYSNNFKDLTESVKDTIDRVHRFLYPRDAMHEFKVLSSGYSRDGTQMSHDIHDLNGAIKDINERVGNNMFHVIIS